MPVADVKSRRQSLGSIRMCSFAESLIPRVGIMELSRRFIFADATTTKNETRKTIANVDTSNRLIEKRNVRPSDNGRQSTKKKD